MLQCILICISLPLMVIVPFYDFSYFSVMSPSFLSVLIIFLSLNF